MKRCFFLRGGCLYCNFDIFFFLFCFVYLSRCVSLYLIKGYWWGKMWSGVSFPSFDRAPPSSCEEAAVCFTASAVTYQQTYFRWLVLLTVIQWQEKTCVSCMISVFSSSNFCLWICSDLCVGSSKIIWTAQLNRRRLLILPQLVYLPQRVKGLSICGYGEAKRCWASVRSYLVFRKPTLIICQCWMNEDSYLQIQEKLFGFLYITFEQTEVSF